MNYLLDTNACIRYLRDPNSRVQREIRSRYAFEINLCSVVLAELYRGSLRSANPSANRSTVDAFAAPYAILPFDAACADTHAAIRVHLERSGTIIGPYDLQIAAIAVVNGLTLITHNTAEFSRVPNLAIEDWEVP